MPEKCKTPHDGGASRNSCAGLFPCCLTTLNLRVQFLIAAYNVRPELATMIAALAFRGGGTHG